MGGLNFWTQKSRIYYDNATPGGGVAIDTTTDITGGGRVIGVPAHILRVGIVITTAYTPPASGALTMTLSRAHPVNASPSSFAVLSFGTTDYDIGDTVWADVIVPVAQASGDDTLTGGTTPQTSLLDVAPSGPMQLDPGDAFELAVTNAAQAGDAVVIVEYIELDEGRRFPNDGVVFVNP